MSLLAPADESEVASAVRGAHDSGEPILVLGNGTKSGFLRPVQAAHSLSVRNHAGITLYSPKELIVSARAGTTLADLEAELVRGGQHIIAEPPDFSELLGADGREVLGPQTLGGVVAANLSGPRRIASGAMRDHVLGVRAVNGRGEVIRSGGRVLKNVTGLDLCKLLSGSYGTLAVLTEITLKVLPAPEAVGTVVLRDLDAEVGVAALSAALVSPFSVSAAAWLPAEAAARVPQLAGFGAAVALARIEDFAPSVAYRTDRLRADLAAFGSAEIVNDEASRAVWRAVRDARSLAVEPGDAIWRVSVPPSAGPRVVRAVEAIGGRCFLDWGGGLAWIAAPASEAAHRAVTAAARAAHGVWTLLRAPEALRVSLDVIPPEPAALAQITRRVKAAFDPKGILNPGRMYGGL